MMEEKKKREDEGKWEEEKKEEEGKGRKGAANPVSFCRIKISFSTATHLFLRQGASRKVWAGHGGEPWAEQT
jgi:hypothetical protein